MKCPNCGNEVYERLDYAIVRCTECFSLWDPFVYPGFAEPDVEIGELWDTSGPGDDFFLHEDESDDWDEEEEDEDEWEDDWEEDRDEWDEDEDEEDDNEWEEDD